MSDNLPRDEITDAIYRFYSLVDAGKADQTIDLFAPDAAWTFGPGTPKPGTI
ncbi:MAG: nuclear transport factor 2 family protein, partial [Caulobacterales bacterium]